MEENRFLAGEHPGGYDLESTRHRMDAFLRAGIDTFIDLTQSHERETYETVLEELGREQGLTTSYHRVSIRDHGVPEPESMIRILDTIDETFKNGRKVYVHCWGGVGRTGMAVGCYLARHGITNEDALAQVNRLYKTRPHNPSFPNSPETREQIQFVLAWREIPAPQNNKDQHTSPA